ncbi:hypothetical protein [Bradyrhizobium japonicum]|uniref:hypothetical protein n=1 Tax=Bradyrhizobium TaxID=374 RepID=UPI0035C8B0A3
MREKAASWSVAFVEVEEIDTINIYWAAILAMRRAVGGSNFATSPDRRETPERHRDPAAAIIRSDTKSASIAAASILAKVSRDALMRTLDTCHPARTLPVTRVNLTVLGAIFNGDSAGWNFRAHYRFVPPADTLTWGDIS